MKKAMYTLILLIGILAIPVVYEPNVTVSPIDIKKISETSFEQELKASENKFPEITKGAEKKIVWYQGQKKKTKYSIVYLHGYSATLMETYPLCEKLAEKLQANIFYSRLTGHGLPGKYLAEAKAENWLSDGEEAYQIGKLLGEKLILVSVSTGSTIALWLGEKHPDIAMQFFLSSNFGVNSAFSSLFLWPWGESLLSKVFGETRSWKPKSSEQAKYWTHEYPSKALIEMFKIVKFSKMLEAEKMTVPASFIYTESDAVVDIGQINKMHRRYGKHTGVKKTLTNFKRAKDHVMAGNIVSPDTTLELSQLMLEQLTAMQNQ